MKMKQEGCGMYFISECMLVQICGMGSTFACTCIYMHATCAMDMSKPAWRLLKDMWCLHFVSKPI
jgi:hypothetical protein